MAKFSGTIKRSDLEGGHWLLVTADGDEYQLEGGSDYAAGQLVEIDGSVDRGAMGLAMTGPILKVKSIKAAAK